VLAEYWKDAPPGMATFLSNHDIFAGRRLWDQLEGDVARYKLAAAGYLLQPGTPFIYYGEEIGLPGIPGLPGDQPIRGPMSWTADVRGAGFTRGVPFRPIAPKVASNNAAAQATDPGSLLNFYKAMLKLRNGHPSIRRGSFEASRADGLMLSWQRRFGGEHTVVAINYAGQPGRAALATLPVGARLVPLFPAGAESLTADPGGQVSAPMAAQSVAVWRVQR
jgi:alpha-amylase